MSTPTKRGPGRPPLTWLDPDGLRALPRGTPVTVETTGRHDKRVGGRMVGVTTTGVELATTRGPLSLLTRSIKRARILDALYEPGDPVVRVGISDQEWRGGVVRCESYEVLVEQIDGSFAWYPEGDLEPADVRDQRPPALRRGPVPTRVS